MKQLVEVNDFGSIDAESDELLNACFEANSAFREVLGGRKFLVLGRKGSGKTAIYKKLLSTRQYDTFCVGHVFTDYPWAYHDLQVVPSAAEQERYLHSWRYLILLSLSKILLNFDSSQPWHADAVDPLAKIESFVIDTYGARDPDITEIFHPGKRLRRLKGLKVDMKFLAADTGPDELAMENLPKVFQDVNRSLQELVLASLNPQNRYYVCFDQLDIGFQPNSSDYKLRLIGLLLAARDFVNAARENGSKLKVLVFLRSDIYHKSLMFEDKNKITDTYKVEIEWDQSEQGPTLKSLMERRFAQVLDIPVANGWDTVFDESMEMRGHQSKYQHILDRTFRRPRDIIKFTNSILKTYRERRANNSEIKNQFTNEDVNLARIEYSDYLRNELVDEIHKYNPEYQIYLEILRQIGYQLFTLRDFTEAYEAWKSRLTDGIQVEEILERLFEFSIIGFYRAGGSGYGGSEYVYKYMDQRAEFNRSAEKFRVHWGLVDSLGLKQYSRE
jgi:hypothetical protein